MFFVPFVGDIIKFWIFGIFNDFSTVYINNKEQENAELISSTMIRVPKRSIKSGDEIAIAQRGNDKIELGRTTYIVPN